MTSKHLFKYSFLLTTCLVILYSCANQGYPSGGAKDETPPKIKKSTPPQNALNFKGKKVKIEFDELIKLDKIHNKFVASPPLKKRPAINPRGNELEIVFDEELQENATYTLDFADAIQDNNEGNAIPFFRFSFSTGEVVDTMAISGHVLSAKDYAPVPGCIVTLYSNLSDTAFTSEVPDRLAKTDETGYFSIRNISPGDYKVYAIKENDNSLFFDQPGESIAWSDSIHQPSFKYITKTDTLENDSVVYSQELIYTPDSLKLFLFEEEYKPQYLLNDERKEAARLSLFFNRGLSIDPEFEITNSETPAQWAIFENSVKNDSVHIWITDSMLYKKDTLSLKFSYLSLDTLNQEYVKTDTLNFYHFVIEKEKKRKRKKKDKPDPIPSLKLEAGGRTVDIKKPFRFSLPTPPTEIHPEMVHLYLKTDTLKTPLEAKLTQDSIQLRKFILDHHWTPGESYICEIDSAAFKGIYGLVNNPTKMEFTVKKINSYGLMLLTIEKPLNNWLVQLLNSREEVIMQNYIPKNGKLAFQFINPATYMLRIVEDKNMNGQWDTGLYIENRQPEKLVYFPDKIQVRSNWTHEIPWNPQEFDIYHFINKHRLKTTNR